MAWMLCEEAAKAAVTFLVGLLLKRWLVTNGVTTCMIGSCQRLSAKRGMCLVCYSRAKAKVESGETTWEKLEQLGLCKPDDKADPFDDAYSKAMRGQ